MAYVDPLDLIPPLPAEQAAAAGQAPVMAPPAVVPPFMRPPTPQPAPVSKFGGAPQAAPPVAQAITSKFGGVPAAAPAPVSKFGGVAVPADQPQHYTFAGIPIPDQVGHPLAQVAAGVNRSIDQIAGLPEWAVRSVANLGIGASNASQGKDWSEGQLQPGLFSAENMAKTLQTVGVTDPGNVKANNLSDKLLQAFGEGAGAMAAPEMFFPKLIGAFKASGVIGEEAANIARALVGEGSSLPQVAKDAIIAGAANASGEGAADKVPAEWQPLVRTLATLGGAVVTGGVVEAVPAIVKGTGKALSNTVAPLTRGGQERLAGEQLVKAATDPQAAQAALRAAPVDVNLTTGPASGDMGLLGKERAVGNDHPAAYNDKLAEQNTNRVNAITSMQVNGSPEAVVGAIRNHLDNIDKQASIAAENARMTGETSVAAARQQAESGVQAAQDTAQARAQAIGEPAAPDVAGSAIRQSYEDARAAAKVKEREIWKAVDPEGKLQLATDQTKTASSEIFKDISPTAKPPDGEEAAIFQAASDLPDVAPLQHLQDLQSRIKTALRAERMTNGESQAWRRMSLLNNAVQKDLETAVAEKVAQEQKAVEAGQMSAADTITARLKAYGQDYLAQPATESLAGGRDVGAGVPGEGPQAVPGVRGAEGLPGQGRPAGGSDQGVSPKEFQSNLDQAALDRLSAARGATKARVETFDNKTLGPLRRRPSTTAPYDVPASAVPQRIFYPRPASREAVQSLRNAVGDEAALSQLEPYAIGKLHRVALNEDGTLNAVKAESWLRNHADALGAFPALSERVRAAAESSKSLTEAQAAAKRTVTAAERAAKDQAAEAEKAAKAKKDEAQAGSIGKIVHADGPEEVTRRVGQVFGRPDAAREMARLRRATHGDKDAQEGLRKSIVDFVTKKFVSNIEAGTSGVGTIKSDAFQTFVREHASTLRAAGFSADEVARMQFVAAELRKASRGVNAVKIKGGSNTPQDVFAKMKGSKSWFELIATFGLGEGVNIFHGPGWGVAAGLAGAAAAAIRRSGLNKVDQLVRDAILDPKLALKLMERVKPQDAAREARGLMQVLTPSNIVRAVLPERRSTRP